MNGCCELRREAAAPLPAATRSAEAKSPTTSRRALRFFVGAFLGFCCCKRQGMRNGMTTKTPSNWIFKGVQFHRFIPFIIPYSHRSQVGQNPLWLNPLWKRAKKKPGTFGGCLSSKSVLQPYLVFADCRNSSESRLNGIGLPNTSPQRESLIPLISDCQQLCLQANKRHCFSANHDCVGEGASWEPCEPPNDLAVLLQLALRKKTRYAPG